MKNQKIIIIKIGSSILLTERNKLDEFRIAQLASQIACLKDEGIHAILVVSGAVACGSKYVEIINNNTLSKQAAAGIGQTFVTSIFSTLFNQKKLHIAQILLRKKDFSSKKARSNIKSTLSLYIKTGFIPLINENDVVELNSFEGNDYLAAEIAMLMQSKKMIMLSTMKGSQFGVGGGEAKEKVRTVLQTKNIDMEIVDGKVNNILLKTLL